MPRPAPEFVEWFMGLPRGWVTEFEFGLTSNQQITALGNGVLPLQASLALRVWVSRLVRSRGHQMPRITEVENSSSSTTLCRYSPPLSLGSREVFPLGVRAVVR